MTSPQPSPTSDYAIEISQCGDHWSWYVYRKTPGSTELASARGCCDSHARAEEIAFSIASMVTMLEQAPR